MRYENEGGVIETGVDALDFVEGLEGGWDCVVWDPPYSDKGGYYDRLSNKKSTKL